MDDEQRVAVLDSGNDLKGNGQNRQDGRMGLDGVQQRQDSGIRSIKKEYM